MANVAINVEVRSNGEVVLGKLGNALKATDEKAKGLTARMGSFAGAIGQTSTALARSASVFGLNASALRALDDAADVAEIGFSNLSKTAVGFNAATVGVAAAAGAVGYAFGSWLRTFPAVQKVADSFIATLYRLTQSQKDLDAQAGAMQGLKAFSERMAAADLEAKKKQIAWMKSQGGTDAELAAFFKGKGPMTAVVGQEAQLRALGLDDASLQRKKKAQEEETKRQKELLDLTRDYNKMLASVVTYREDDADVLRDLEAQSKALVDDMEKVTAANLAALKGTRLREGDMLFGDSGLWTRFPDVIEAEMEAAAAGTEKVTEQTMEWYDAIQGVAAQFERLADVGGPIGAIGKMIGDILTAVAGIGAGLESIQTAGGGFSGFLQKLTGIGGVVGGVIGIGSAIWGGIKGLFGGKSREEKEAERRAKLQAEEDRRRAEEEAARRRAAGVTTAQGGISGVIANLTYTDAKGQVINTFSDPKVAEAAAGLFGATFWETFRQEGIAGIDKLRPAWEKLHEQLIKMGLDPVKMGLGRIGQLMDITKDPKTKALLGVSQGAGQLLRGAMDAGYVDQGFLKDSTTIARSTLQELQAQGLDANTAALSMADQLVALNQAYAATGQEMPEDLKAAMEAAGITVLPTQLEVMKESRDYLKQIAGASGHAEGAIVTRPHLAWVGEKGPEAIIPLNGRGRAQMGSSINVNINRSLGVTRETEYAFDRRVERTVRRLFRQSAAVRYDTRVAVNGGR